MTRLERIHDLIQSYLIGVRQGRDYATRVARGECEAQVGPIRMSCGCPPCSCQGIGWDAGYDAEVRP